MRFGELAVSLGEDNYRPKATVVKSLDFVSNGGKRGSETQVKFRIQTSEGGCPRTGCLISPEKKRTPREFDPNGKDKERLHVSNTK